jgi:hypothetical protein
MMEKQKIPESNIKSLVFIRNLGQSKVNVEIKTVQKEYRKTVPQMQ